MKAGALGAARRYARALLDLSLEGGNPAKLRDELRQAAALLQEHKDLTSALAHPAIAPARKKQILAAVWGAETGSELLLRLLELLVQRGRLNLLPAIAVAFTALWNQQRGVVAAQAVSARELDAAQLEGLGRAIRQATGMDVELEARADPALIGGVLVKLGGRVFDGSVRARLSSLRAHLSGAARASS